MALSRRSSRTRNVIAVLVLAALTIITIDARGSSTGVINRVRGGVSDVFSPLQRATHDALAPIGNFLTGALKYGSERSENQRLRQELAAASNQQAAAAAAQQEADQVLAEQHLSFISGIPTLSAQIIDMGSSNFDNTLTIDKGTGNGVAVGQPVVAADGLVGTIASASKHTATVELLTDPSFVVGVDLQGNNVGSAAGQGGSQPMRVTVDSTANPQPPAQKVGDVLHTSGLSLEKFPAGIPVGRVSKVVSQPGAVEPSIYSTPLVNVSQLSYLQVLLWSPQ